MESGPDAVEIDDPSIRNDTTPNTVTAASTDLPPSPYAPWRDVGIDTYSSEYESGALSACTEPNDDWLGSPAHIANSSESKVKDTATFYPNRPRTITLLLFLVLVLVGTAFQRSNSEFDSNIWAGISVASFVLLTVGILVFPTGPFVYPHPVVWRLLFGISVLYLLSLDFVLFQQYRFVRAILLPLDPTYADETSNSTTLPSDGEHGECSLSFHNVWTKLDRSAARQTVCWAVKAIVVRDSGVLWVLNVLQELTEVYVGTLLPSQAGECCWWQSLALDPLFLNALGIQAGMYICKKLEMMELQWEEIISLKNTTSRIKRAVLQFTPEAWARIRWLDLNATQYKRYVGAVALLLGVQLMDLNSIFLQHVFDLPPRHYFLLARIVLLSLIGAPSVQQLYLYITGRSYGRLGSQCWVYFAIVLSELVVLAKFGKEVMDEDLRRNVAAMMWVVVLSSGAAIGILAVYQNKGFVRIPSYRRKKLIKKRKRSYRMHEQEGSMAN